MQGSEMLRRIPVDVPLWPPYVFTTIHFGEDSDYLIFFLAELEAFHLDVEAFWDITKLTVVR